MNLDGFGTQGAVLVYGMTLSLFGGACLLFFYCWKRGRLDFEESPKWSLLEHNEEPCDDKRR